MKRIFYHQTCPRCNHTLKYLHDHRPVYTNGRCKYCKPVSDENLQQFRNFEYSRICPQCKRTVLYKNRLSFLQSVRLNFSCKSCSHIPSVERRQNNWKKQWIPIIGYWPKYKTFVMIRKHWSSLNDEEKFKLLQKTPKQRYWYWGHLHRKNHNDGHRKCREVMSIKYSGENHWMKRPEVLAKVKKTCEKYRGDNHWFRRKK